MLYAAYGSNLHPLRLIERCSSARPLGVSTLNGWQIAFNKHGQDESGKANIFVDRGAVYVSVYELGDADGPKLDAIEGPGYEVREIELPYFGRSFTYVATALGDLAPYEWYRDLVLVGAQYHRFPTAYVDAIAAIPVMSDPDAQRSAAHHALLRRMSNYR